MGEGGTREGVVQSVIDWKCKLAEGGTSTATTRQMAIGQRVRVSKFANRGNKFDFVLEIIKSPPRNLHSLQFHPVDVRNSTYDHPPYFFLANNQTEKPLLSITPPDLSRFLKSTICHARQPMYASSSSKTAIRGNRREKGEKIVRRSIGLDVYRREHGEI